MPVEVIESWPQFAGLEQEWRRIHAVDPQSGYFLSWDWLSKVFQANPGKWQVLAVREDGGDRSYAGFLPLRISKGWSNSRRAERTEFSAAGRLGWAQYSGFLCAVKDESRVVVEIGAALRRAPWGTMQLKHDPSAGRLKVFLRGFSSDEYEISNRKHLINDGTVDSLICPVLDLPTDYDVWMQSMLSANTRQKIRRFQRRYDQDSDMRITRSNPETVRDDLQILLDLWEQKWAPIRGAESARKAVQRYRRFLAHSIELDALEIPILWKGGRPLGALGNVVDRDKGHLYFILAGRDESVPDNGIGLLLHSEAIGRAIKDGIKAYDFCHGNERYKYSLGARDVPVSNVKIRRRSKCPVPIHESGIQDSPRLAELA